MKPLISTKALNTTIAIAALVVLMLFLWTYSETGSPPTLSDAELSNPSPVYYLINAKSTQFSESGTLEMTMKNDSIRHEPQNNSALLKQPRIALYRDGVLDWTARSDTGVVYKDSNRIDLEQRVIIASGDNQTVLKTPYLELYPGEKKAETNKPVTLQSPTGFTRSVGVEANLESKQIHLLDQVRGNYNAVP